jgi:hypothetical protein
MLPCTLPKIPKFCDTLNTLGIMCFFNTPRRSPKVARTLLSLLFQQDYSARLATVPGISRFLRLLHYWEAWPLPFRANGKSDPALHIGGLVGMPALRVHSLRNSFDHVGNILQPVGSRRCRHVGCEDHIAE